MKISELPTPRLRARAMALYTLHSIMNDLERFDDFDLFCAFDWEHSNEGFDFWDAVADGYYDKAKELQPDLFKPVDGKPHIVLSGIYNEQCAILGPELIGYTLDCVTDNQDVINYVLDVQNSMWYTTIQEAVDALYSFKRATDVAGEVV